MKDVHSVFAGLVACTLLPLLTRGSWSPSLVLMTYYGVVLLLSGYQADESHILKQYKAMVDRFSFFSASGAITELYCPPASNLGILWVLSGF